MVDFFRPKKTEIFLTFYVAIGFLLIIVTSKIDYFDDFEMINENKITIIKILTLTLLSGIFTYFIRRHCYKFNQSFSRDANELSRIEFFGIVYAALLVFLGYYGMNLHPISIDFIYVFFLIIMVAVISLNIYFSSFWLQQTQGNDIASNLELNKLEHVEWNTMFNNICLAFLVAAGSVIFTLISQKDNLNSFKVLLDGFLIIYIVFGAPIIWLLRPIHITMNNIRKKIYKKTRASDMMPQTEHSGVRGR